MNRRAGSMVLIVSFLAAASAGYAAEMPDFATMEKVDAHFHIRHPGPEVLDQAKADNFRIIAIHTDHYDLPWQEAFIAQQRAHHPDQFRYIGSFAMAGWNEPDWQQKTLEQIKKLFDNGSIGVKVWKNIGMDFRDKAGDFVTIDHPRFDPILDYIERQNKTLLFHIAEPYDCWLPLDQMASNRSYYESNPQYHMYLHPEYPSYEALVASYQDMLDKHPGLRVVGAHLASIEWNLNRLAKVLDKYPNLGVDLSARIDDIQRLDRDEVRAFLLRYADRILYGTDLSIKEDNDGVAFAARMHERWTSDWIYLTTDQTQDIKGIAQPVRGLALPPDIVEKVYRLNAEKYYPDLLQP